MRASSYGTQSTNPREDGCVLEGIWDNNELNGRVRVQYSDREGGEWVGAGMGMVGFDGTVKNGQIHGAGVAVL